MKWQSIETAPRDGTPVLLYQPTEGGCFLPNDIEVEHYTFTGYHRDGQWFCWEYDACDYMPTHWMPLPAPPESRP